jgi:hypothetical protein
LPKIIHHQIGHLPLTDKIRRFLSPSHGRFSFFGEKNYLNVKSMRGVICKLNKVNLVFLEENEGILKPIYVRGYLPVF